MARASMAARPSPSSAFPTISGKTGPPTTACFPAASTSSSPPAPSSAPCRAASPWRSEMYVAVKGGETAIAHSLDLVADKRRGDRGIAELSLAQIDQQLGLAVDRV